MTNSNSRSNNIDPGHAPKKQIGTRYALHFVRGPFKDHYVTSFTQHGWMFDHDGDLKNAYLFVSMTQALCVAFCLMIDQACEVLPIRNPNQLELLL